jgi:hypothetical protein
MIASATFILISVDAFRKDDGAVTGDRKSGTGGYGLLVESLLPLVNDPATPAGRETLGIAAMDAGTIEPFRVRPGAEFLYDERFTFQSSLAADEQERANPWLLLRRQESDGAIPVIADANSMTYVLHRRLGDDIVITVGNRPVRLRLVASCFRNRKVISCFLSKVLQIKLRR